MLLELVRLAMHFLLDETNCDFMICRTDRTSFEVAVIMWMFIAGSFGESSFGLHHQILGPLKTFCRNDVNIIV